MQDLQTKYNISDKDITSLDIAVESVMMDERHDAYCEGNYDQNYQ